MSLVFVSDIGRSGVKPFYKRALPVIESWVGSAVELAYGYQDRPGSFRVENPETGEKLFVGKLARQQANNPRQPFYKTKAHMDNLYLALCSLYDANIRHGIVTLAMPIPFNYWNEKEINAIRKLFERRHKYIINDKGIDLTIDRIRLAPEAVVSANLLPKQAIVGDKKLRILEVGHATSTFATFDITDEGALEFNNRETGVLNEGWGTNQESVDPDPKELTNQLIAESSKRWEVREKDRMMVIGGVAGELSPFVQEHFDKEVIVPENPRYANSEAFWEALNVERR